MTAGHKLYFTRHGQSEWNVANRICGATDIALTDTGRAQALETAARIREAGYRIDRILYSPLVRARETALIISNTLQIPAAEEQRLYEQRFGKYEGTPRNGEEFRLSKQHFVNRYGGGESMLRLAQRIYNLLDDLEKDRDTVYLLVAHNGIARMVQSYFYEMSNEDYAAFGIRNCELVEYDFSTADGFSGRQ